MQTIARTEKFDLRQFVVAGMFEPLNEFRGKGQRALIGKIHHHTVTLAVITRCRGARLIQAQLSPPFDSGVDFRVGRLNHGYLSNAQENDLGAQ